MTLTLRYMRFSDISQVVEIDRHSFETPWSARSYAYEIGESNYSHMVVLEMLRPQPANGWRRFVHSLLGDPNPHYERQIVSYGGLWRILDEAHISTIATHKDWRGHGYGEIALAAMIRRALTLGASYIVLEVRVSNSVAQKLYIKYEFQVFDTKRGYYRDNGEDAFDMRLNLEDAGMVERFNARFTALREKHGFEDLYTAAEPAAL